MVVNRNIDWEAMPTKTGTSVIKSVGAPFRRGGKAWMKDMSGTERASWKSYRTTQHYR
jgi:hypothetical protein